VNKVTGLDVLMSELPSKLFLCSTWPDGMIINKKCFIAPLLLYILRAKKLNLGLSYWILLSLSKNHFFSRDRVIFTIFFFKIQTATNGRKFSCAMPSELHSCVTKIEVHFPKRAGVNKSAWIKLWLLILLLNILRYCSSTLPLHW
jgi:hypothetical protein